MFRLVPVLIILTYVLLIKCTSNNVSKEVLSSTYYKDVAIEAGTVRGFLAEDGDYLAFLGIPYAAAPVGNLRFKSPVPPSPWENVFIANRTVRCPQRGSGDENCLILNVFTPTKILNGPLAVLFYIHGGSFLTGAGQTKGVEPLLQQNVIVVTINYRLGALGFLCLGRNEAPGNAGLKDQVAALKWVKRNIDKFGGDPNQVTIYGMSAGGTSVEMLVLSKMAEGLYHRAIIESGAASAVWSLDANPIETAKNLAVSLNFPKDTKDWSELIDYYQKIPANDLNVANYDYYQNLTDGTFGFVPCLERKLNHIEPFLTIAPNKILKKGVYNKVPMMIIFTSMEGLFLRSSDYYQLNYKDKMNDNFEVFMPADLVFDSEEIKKANAENVKQFYFGANPVGNSTLKGYLDYFGDYLILHGLLNSAVTYSKNNKDVYLIEFAYKGKLGSYDEFFKDINSAGHGDAVKYTILNNVIDNKDDELIVNRMTEIVANFMKYANPSPTRSELIPIIWPAVQPDSVTYLHLDKDLQVLEEPFWERKIFWDKLYDCYRRPIRPVDPNLL